MFLIGKWIGRPESGFGADYPAAFWVNNNDTEVVPDDPDRYTVTFDPDGINHVQIHGSSPP